MTTTPLYTYSDTHTGEFDNYAVVSGEQMAVYAYHTNDRHPGASTLYVPEFSMLYRRTNRTVEGERAEDPDAWEPATDDTHSPDHDVNPGLTGDELAVDGTVWAADFHAPMPPLPDGWPSTRPLIAAPARPGWQADTHTFTVTVSGCTAEQAAQVMSERIGPDEDYGFHYRIEWN